MKGLMQDYPLVVNSILDYASKFHGEQEVVTCTVEGGLHRYTYADMHRRAQLCALALRKLAVRLAIHSIGSFHCGLHAQAYVAAGKAA